MPTAPRENRIGRRLRFRDLQVFFAVVPAGSMAKAATELGVTQPAVSEVVAGLEHAFGVRLFDRSPQGVEPTIYGRALLKRGIAAFDELKQGIRDIEFLADPTRGEVRIGCPDSLAGGLLAPAMRVMTFSVQLRAHLLATGDFLAAMPKSMLKLNPECRGLKELPVRLPSPRFPVAIVTLKGRTLAPPVELFLERLREHVRE